MSDLILRMDAVQACQVGPSDEWSRDTKSGYNQAATDCATNILHVPAVQPVAHEYEPSMDPNDQGECVICGGGPHTAVQPVTAQAQIDAAVAAERKRMKPFVNTSQRFHRRMQLLEGYWAGKLARANAERLFWKQAYCRQHSPAEGFQKEAFERGVSAVCDALREHTAFYTYYAFLVEKVREEVIKKGDGS